MLHELRMYYAMPGMFSALNDRFANHTVGFFKKHGIGMVGFWTDEIGTANKLTYMLKFDGMGDRETKWDAFQADTEWQRIREETDRNGPMLEVLENTFMRPTYYSPEPKITSNVQELRTYEVVPGKLAALNERFANLADPLFRKHGMETIGYWTNVVGTSNRLVYMLGFPSLADREKSWQAFRTDPDWRKGMRESDERHGPLNGLAYSTILRPTTYSPRE